MRFQRKGFTLKGDSLKAGTCQQHAFDARKRHLSTSSEVSPTALVQEGTASFGCSQSMPRWSIGSKRISWDGDPESGTVAPSCSPYHSKSRSAHPALEVPQHMSREDLAENPDMLVINGRSQAYQLRTPGLMIPFGKFSEIAHHRLTACKTKGFGAQKNCKPKPLIRTP